MNTSPQNDLNKKAELQDCMDVLPQFLLFSSQSCVVYLVDTVTQQTMPSKAKAELLADGQCEV